MFYSRTSEALFLFIRLLLAGSVAFTTYPSKLAGRGIIKRINPEQKITPNFNFSIDILNLT